MRINQIVRNQLKFIENCSSQPTSLPASLPASQPASKNCLM